MRKRVSIAVIILAALLTVFSACGKSGEQSFYVEYVGTVNVLSPDLFIHGEMDGDSMNISINKAFKDCDVVDISFVEGENVTLGGTAEGYLYYVGGVIVVLEDKSGKSFEVTVKEGSSFDVEKDGDTVCLLPPK